jgi:uncharacterized membrane protein
MMKQFRNTMLAGILALLPLYLTVALLAWLFDSVDMLFQPWLSETFDVDIWGLGILATAIIIFATGVMVSSVGGAFFMDGLDRLFERVPIVKGLYRGIKQIINSFNPENPSGFKEFVLIEEMDGRGYTGGFKTSEFTLIEVDGTRRELATVFIPSNHLYLGAIHIVDRSRLLKTALSVQDGVTYSLSAGAALRGTLRQIDESGGVPTTSA